MKIEGDYYALLGVDRDATQEELKKVRPSARSPPSAAPPRSPPSAAPPPPCLTRSPRWSRRTIGGR